MPDMIDLATNEVVPEPVKTEESDPVTNDFLRSIVNQASTLDEVTTLDSVMDGEDQ